MTEKRNSLQKSQQVKYNMTYANIELVHLQINPPIHFRKASKHTKLSLFNQHMISFTTLKGDCDLQEQLKVITKLFPFIEFKCYI